jgi:hypothetical protein
MNFRIEGLEVVETQEGRVTVHRLHNGDRLPIVAPPSSNGVLPQETHLAAAPVRKAADAFAKVEAARRAAANDPTLSEVGRANKVQAVRSIASDAVRDAEYDLAGLAKVAEAAHVEAYTPPKIQPGDVENVFIDQEVRHYVRGLSGKGLTDYLQGLERNPRHLEAIMRSPVPMPNVDQYAKRLWETRMQGTSKAVSAKAYADALEWANGTLAQIKAKV